jgi:hypothetical protein
VHRCRANLDHAAHDPCRRDHRPAAHGCIVDRPVVATTSAGRPQRGNPLSHQQPHTCRFWHQWPGTLFPFRCLFRQLRHWNAATANKARVAWVLASRASRSHSDASCRHSSRDSIYRTAPFKEMLSDGPHRRAAPPTYKIRLLADATAINGLGPSARKRVDRGPLGSAICQGARLSELVECLLPSRSTAGRVGRAAIRSTGRGPHATVSHQRGPGGAWPSGSLIGGGSTAGT